MIITRSIDCAHQYLEYISSCYVTIGCIHDHLFLYTCIHISNQYKLVISSILWSLWIISCNAISHYTKYNHVVDSKLNLHKSVTYLPLSIHKQTGRSALLLASQNGYLELVEFLLEKGVSIYDKDKVRYTVSASYILCFFYVLVPPSAYVPWLL